MLETWERGRLARPARIVEAPRRAGRPRSQAAGLVFLVPALYLTYLLTAQLVADWPVLSQPAFDLDTALALAASSYLLLLLATYWRKPPFRAERCDLTAIVITGVAMDALGLIVRQPITQSDAWPAAAMLMLLGTLLATSSVSALGTSFSLLPQARNVVASGPYAYLRHPMYAGGILITLGELWLRWAPLPVLLCLVALGAQLVRMHMEERLLESEFPEYRSYRTRTSALVPGIY